MKPRLKSFAKLVTDVGQNEARPYIALEHVESGSGRLVPGTELADTEQSAAGVALARPGDVLFGKLRPYLAKVFFAEKELLASTELMCIRPNEALEPRWFYYLCLSRALIEWSVATSEGTKMPRTSWEKLAEFRVDILSGQTQRTIADFLDRETARIDSLSDKKERLIDVLAERRRGLISRLIWGRDVFSYDERRLKYLAGFPTSGNRDHSSFTFSDHGIPCLRGLNVRPGRIERIELLRIAEKDHERHAPTALQAGDLVIVRSGIAGSAAVIPEDLDDCNCVDLVIVRRSPLLVPEYLQYVVNSREAQEQVLVEQSGALLKHFNAVDAGGLTIPYRPLEEQRRIVRMLDEQAGKLQETGKRILAQVGLLQERRQALITAAVTGQVQVSGAA